MLGSNAESAGRPRGIGEGERGEEKSAELNGIVRGTSEEVRQGDEVVLAVRGGGGST